MKRLAIVIPAGGGSEAVARCLRSIGAREDLLGEVEVLVVAPNMAVAATATLGRDWVRIVDAEPYDRYARLRARGLAAANAPYVAILSEDYTVDAAWLERALAAAELDADVVAGVTRPSSHANLAGRAAWLWEYAHLAPPIEGGELDERQATQTPAGNVVYRRAAIDPEWLAAADSELEYHAEMHRRGLRFVRDPRLCAAYRPPPFQRFVRDRARWSAIWAEPRAAGKGFAGRILTASSRLFLPPVLLARLVRRIAAKPRHWPLAVAASPLFLRLSIAQTTGEMRAYLRRR